LSPPCFFASDGNSLVAGCLDQTICFWRTSDWDGFAPLTNTGAGDHRAWPLPPTARDPVRRGSERRPSRPGAAVGGLECQAKLARSYRPGLVAGVLHGRQQAGYPAATIIWSGFGKLQWSVGDKSHHPHAPITRILLCPGTLEQLASPAPTLPAALDGPNGCSSLSPGLPHQSSQRVGLLAGCNLPQASGGGCLDNTFASGVVPNGSRLQTIPGFSPMGYSPAISPDTSLIAVAGDRSMKSHQTPGDRLSRHSGRQTFAQSPTARRGSGVFLEPTIPGPRRVLCFYPL